MGTVSASLIFYGDQSRHFDLRLRTAAELCKNSRHYAEAIVHRASSCANSMSPAALLSSTLQRSTSLVFSKALESCPSLQDAYFQAAQEEIKNTCSSGWYSSVLQVLGLSTAVGTTINLIYPMYNGGIRSFLHTKVNPMGVESGSGYSINIMWSTTQKNATSAWFEPNHFVPLLPRSSEFSMPTRALHSVKSLKSTNLKSFQCKMQDFFTSSTDNQRPTKLQTSILGEIQRKSAEDADHLTINHQLFFR